MPSIYDVKPAFQDRLRPISEHMVRAGFTANQVTVVALIMSILVGMMLFVSAPTRWPLLILPVWLFVRMALNAIDGMIAREHNMKSNLGALLNEIGDVVADAALYLPLAYYLTPGSAVLLVIAVMLGIVTELAGIAAVQIGARRRYDGPMGKSDRAFWLGALALAMAFGFPAGYITGFFLLVIDALLAFTIFNRAFLALVESSRNP